MRIETKKEHIIYVSDIEMEIIIKSAFKMAERGLLDNKSFLFYMNIIRWVKQEKEVERFEKVYAENFPLGA